MINVGLLFIYGAMVILGLLALSRGDGTFRRGLIRAVEQFVRIVPRMLCALLAAGFVAKLIPTAVISRFLGDGAGLIGILTGTMTGFIVPSGPVISFSIAAAFAHQGASVPALVSFITAWSVFAAHRVVIFEIPLLGPSFVRLRLLSVLVLPLLAGGLALAGGRLVALLLQ